MKIRRNWWKSTRIIVTQWESVRIGENYYKSIRITKKKNKMKEIKTWRDRKRKFFRERRCSRFRVSLLLLLLESYQFRRGHLHLYATRNGSISPSFALFSLYARWRSSSIPRPIDGGCRRQFLGGCCLFNDERSGYCIWLRGYNDGQRYWGFLWR